MSWNRRRLFAVAAVTVVLALAVVGGTLVYVGAVDASRVNRFKDRARTDWGGLADDARSVARALGGVNSPESLDLVAERASGMSRSLDELGGRVGRQAPPPGYGQVAGKQKTAVADLKSYVDKVFELARIKEEQALAEQRGVLENRSRKALQSVNAFLYDADFLSVNIPGDFYQAGSAMANAYRPPDYASDVERKAIYDTMNEFMRADVKDNDFEKVWSMLSGRLIYGLTYNQITKERLVANWRNMWGDKTPVDFYVSWRDINIPYPTTATSVVIAYMRDGGPRTGTVRLVKEQGVWKIDSYPFVGLLG